MSETGPNDSGEEGIIQQNDANNTQLVEFANARELPTGLIVSTSWFPAMGRTMVPAFIRHNFFRISHWVQQAVRYESETGAKFLVLPIAFAIGAITYFTLPREPLLVALLIAFAIFAFFANKSYGSLAGNMMLTAAFVLAGMTAGKLRTDMVDTIMISKPIQVQLNGIVLNRETRSNGRKRYTILVRDFEDSKSAVPGIVRVTAHKKYDLVEFGQSISGLARLRPPSGPAYPGGYDFSFQSWFNGIGANGFFLARIIHQAFPISSGRKGLAELTAVT